MSVEFWNGNRAAAAAVRQAQVQVVAAYPITPQTHIVEHLARLVADGEADCEVVSVESEFSAASVVLGAAVAGSRAYTASSSQGILLMAEVLYNIAGMRVPLVLTCANRTVGAPINIWNDHQDSMAVRDSGWIQLYCVDNQDAVDTTVQAFRLAEELEVPVMVCVDGFILTHLFEPIDLPAQELIDGFLKPYAFSRQLDPRAPLSLGALVGPDYFTETRHALDDAMMRAVDLIPAIDAEWRDAGGHETGGLLRVEGGPDAEIGVLTLGSVFGTLSEARAELLPDAPIRLMALRTFRPFPVEALRAACAGLRELVVLERALSPGAGAIVGTEVRAALAGMDAPPRVHACAAGLGGRDIPMDLLPRLLEVAGAEHPARFRIVDLAVDKIETEQAKSA